MLINVSTDEIKANESLLHACIQLVCHNINCKNNLQFYFYQNKEQTNLVLNYLKVKQWLQGLGHSHIPSSSLCFQVMFSFDCFHEQLQNWQLCKKQVNHIIQLPVFYEYYVYHRQKQTGILFWWDQSKWITKTEQTGILDQASPFHFTAKFCQN